MRTLLASLLLMLAAPAASAPPPGSAEFDAGVAAYRAGDPARALERFERARALGYDSPQLRFNLGLSCYQLERYAEARAWFEALRHDAGFEGIADFHLALVAARQGDPARARAMWRDLVRGPDPGLARRARAALARLDAGRSLPPATRYLLAGAGYDTNPVLLDEGVQPAGGSESPALELLGLVGVPLAGHARAATVVRGGLYLKDYREDVGADQRGLFAGLWRELDDGSRRLGFALEASLSDYDGEPFQRIAGVRVERSPGSRVGWLLSAQVSHVGAASAYAHLEGWRARAGVGRQARVGSARLRLGYDLELNDREDLRDGNEFFSQSPLRQRVEAIAEHPAGAATTLRWSVRYRDSRYRDDDRFLDGAVLREERRVERLWQAGLQARRRLGGSANLLAEYQYSRNAATFEGYAFDRHVALLGWEFVAVR